MLLTIFVITILCFAVAYKFYGGFQSRFYDLDPNRKTPATELQDDIDYCPAHPAVLMGHHFASIAGAGPVVGPIAAAAALGWLPTLLWIIIGCIFFGGVHDMGALVASIRHKGMSIGEVVRQWIGARGHKLFLAFTWLSLTLVIAVFLELAAQTFAADPAVAFTATLYIFLAMVFGVAIYHYGISLKVSTIIMLPILFGSLIFGIESSWVQSTFALSLDTWRMALIVYIFAASVLPVWLLLQPRDYLASYMLYFSVFIGGVGMIFGGASYEVKLPAFKGFVTASGDWLWPLLFITVACGAISGFHSLVSSGTTSKQLDKEKDAKPIAYGGMLLECVLAVVTICAINYAYKYNAANPDTPLKGATGIFAGGIDNMYAGLGPKAVNILRTLLTLTYSAFCLTSLDTATRLARFMFQEFWLEPGQTVKDVKQGWKKVLVNPYFATTLTVVLGIALGMTGYSKIWGLFGAANQLLAGIGLLAVAAWLANCG